MRYCFVLILLFFVGCSGDPSNDALSSGSLVVVSAEKGCSFENDDQKTVTRLQSGSTLRVGYDPGYRNKDEFVCSDPKPGGPDCDQQKDMYNRAKHEKIYPPESGAQFRRIKVTVESGAALGHSGEVQRGDVVPVP